MNDAEAHPSPASLPVKSRTSEQNRTASTGRNAPTTFFFLTEDQVQRASATTAESPVAAESSTYGIQSLASTASSVQQSHVEPTQYLDDETSSQAQSYQSQSSQNTIVPDDDDARPNPTCTPPAQTDLSLHPTSSQGSTNSSPTRFLPRHVSATALTGHLTPLHLYSPAGDSDSGPIGTPKSVSIRSLRLSDDDSAIDDSASQAVTSGDEEDENPASSSCPQDAAPQLVMPNLRLPSRRPFTQRGKDIGKLKIMITGAKGVGKTSLIKSIVQVCEDIVHIDPLNLSTSTLKAPEQAATKQQPNLSTQNPSTAEISASTRAYPQWWSDLEESRMLRRRQSLGEQVLERNITFLDSPGFDPESLDSQDFDSVTEPVESCLRRNLDLDSLSDGEILSILSGNGGVQVDLTIYMFSGKPTQRDVDNLKSLYPKTHIVPVIAKADLLSPDQIQEIESAIFNDIRAAGIELTPLGVATSSPVQPPTSQRLIWTVSSAPGNDDENMDASLLMSPDYVQPLISSDLSELVRQIFDPETAAWLRHSGAKKFLRWRNVSMQFPQRTTSYPKHSTASKPSSPSHAASSSASSLSFPHQQLPRRASTPITTATSQGLHLQIPMAPPATYSTARILDHTQRQEQRAQVRLAWWAADLQRSLANERARYEQVHREERKRWLLDRFSELSEADHAQHISHVATAYPPDALRPSVRRGNTPFAKGDPASFSTASATTFTTLRIPDHHDPLGLLALDEHIRRNGLVVVKVLGGCGVLGAMVVWVIRNWGRELGFGNETSAFGPAAWMFGCGMRE